MSLRGAKRRSNPPLWKEKEIALSKAKGSHSLREDRLAMTLVYSFFNPLFLQLLYLCKTRVIFPEKPLAGSLPHPPRKTFPPCGPRLHMLRGQAFSLNASLLIPRPLLPYHTPPHPQPSRRCAPGQVLPSDLRSRKLRIGIPPMLIARGAGGGRREISPFIPYPLLSVCPFSLPHPPSPSPSVSLYSPSSPVPFSQLTLGEGELEVEGGMAGQVYLLIYAARQGTGS